MVVVVLEVEVVVVVLVDVLVVVEVDVLVVLVEDVLDVVVVVGIGPRTPTKASNSSQHPLTPE